MPGHRSLRSRGLGALIGLVAVLTGAGAIGNGRQLPPPATVPATPTAAESSVQPNVAAEAPSGAPSTKSQSSLHPMVEPGDAPAIKGDPRYGSELRFARPDWRPGSVALAEHGIEDRCLLGVAGEPDVGDRDEPEPRILDPPFEHVRHDHLDLLGDLDIARVTHQSLGFSTISNVSMTSSILMSE